MAPAASSAALVSTGSTDGQPPVVDGIWALVALALGFLFWNWLIPTTTEVVLDASPNSDTVAYYDRLPAVAVTALLMLGLGCSLVYFRRTGRTLSRAAVIGLVLLILGAIPHALYAPTVPHVFSGLALLAGYGSWHAYAAGTAIAPNLSALSIADAVNQGIVVPFANFGAWFAGLRSLGRGKRPAKFLIGLAGVVIALPVFAIVTSLLVSADDQFGSWVSGILDWLGELSVWTYVFHLVLGIPVAIWIFAWWFANARRAGTDRITAAGAQRSAAAARRLSTVALAAPATVLAVIYLVFFAAMSNYLFSAFRGQLPPDFTYAVYARQGFFELVTVAAINLVVLWIMYATARRRGAGNCEPGGARPDDARINPATGYPAPLRVLGGILSGLTLAMVAVAMSKMLLYLGRFDLSQLRLYTLWFMGVLLVVVTLLLVWHIRPYRVSVPVVWVSILAFLALVWSNSDGIIARYNVNQYLAGASATIDIDYLATSLSDAAIPALLDLRAAAPELADDVTAALADRIALAETGDLPWTAWNVQTWQADTLLTD
jgi:hypothetical protein